MSCPLNIPILNQAESAGITDTHLISDAYRNNHNKLFTEAPIYKKLSEEINQTDTSLPDEAMLLTIYSLTSSFNRSGIDPTLNNLREYAKRILERKNQERKRKEESFEILPKYGHTFGTEGREFTVDAAVGEELYSVLLAFQGLPKSEVEELIRKKIEELSLNIAFSEESRIQHENLSNVYIHLDKIYDWFREIRKADTGIVEEQEDFPQDDSIETSPPKEDSVEPVSEEVAGALFNRETKHVIDLVGRELRVVMDTMPILEKTWVTENGVTKQVTQVRMSKLFGFEMAKEKNKENYNYVQQIVTGATSYAEALRRLNKEVRRFPSLAKLLKALPPANYSKVENSEQRERYARLANDFMNTFSLKEVTPYHVYIGMNEAIKAPYSRVYSLMSRSERFRVQEYDKDFTKASERAAVITDGKLDLSKLFAFHKDKSGVEISSKVLVPLLKPKSKKEEVEEKKEAVEKIDKYTWQVILRGLRHRRSQPMYSYDEESGKYYITNKEDQADFNKLMELLFLLGVNEAKEFKSYGKYHSEAIEFFYVNSPTEESITETTYTDKETKKEVKKKTKVTEYKRISQMAAIVGKMVEKFKKESSKKEGGNFLIDNPFSFIYEIDSKESEKDSSLLGIKKTEVKLLNQLVNKISPFEYSPVFFNDEDKLKYAVGQRFYLVQLTEKINNASDLGDLVRSTSLSDVDPNLVSSHFDFIDNPDIIGSSWLSKMFEGFPRSANQIKEQMASRGLDYRNRDARLAYYSTFKKVSGAEINIRDFIGIKNARIDEGKTTSSLNDSHKLEQDFIGFFDNFIVENIRFGEKTSSYATELSYADRDKNPYYIDFAKIPDYSSTKLIDTNKVRTLFGVYVESDVLRIFKNIIQEGTIAQTENDFRVIYGDINRDEESVAKRDAIQEKIDSIRRQYKEDKTIDLDKAQNEVLTLYRDFVLESLPDYIEKQRNLLKAIYAEGLRAEVDRDSAIAERLNSLGINRFKSEANKVTKENLNYLLDFFVLNMLAHNIEFMKFFHGSLASFNPGKTRDSWREPFKRIVNMSSPGKVSQTDQEFSNTLKKSEAGNAFSNLFNSSQSSAQRWGVLKVLTYHDVDSSFTPKNATKEEKEKIWKAYREKYSLPDKEVYRAYVNGPKEADAQAVSNLEFYRNYLVSTGTWEAEQDVTYDLELQIAKQLLKLETASDINILNNINKEIARLKQLITDKIESGEAKPFPPLKLGHYGKSADNAGDLVYHKMSVLPMLPSEVSEFRNMYPLFKSMFQQGADYFVFGSGSKEKNTKPVLPFYNEDGTINSNFNTVDHLSNLRVENLRELQYQAPKFKSNAVLTTQGMKLLFSNLFEDGAQRSNDSDFRNFVETQNNKLRNALDGLQEIKKEKLLRDLGLIETENGNFKLVDETKFAESIAAELDETEELRRYFEVDSEGRLRFSLDSYHHKNKLFQKILNKVTKNIISLKINGDSLIQAANTPFLGRRNFQEFIGGKKSKQLQFDSSLEFYRIVDGKIAPMEVMVAFDPNKHDALLNLKYEGKRIRDYENPLELLNSLLGGQNKEWLETHKKKFMYTAVRIPVQGLLSMESMIVKKFLPSSAGNVIILPPQIVTKSGGDYDIDKLTVYYPNLSGSGEIITSDASLADYKETFRDMQATKQSLLIARKKLQLLLDSQQFPQEQKKLKNWIKQLSKIKGDLGNLEVKLDPTKLKEELDSLITNLPRKVEKYLAKANLELAYENQIIQVMQDMLEREEVYLDLIKPNDSPNLKTKAEQVDSNPISGMDVFSPATSYRIFKENILARSALGIDAKMNTMHKMFQQAGIQLGFESSHLYGFPSNRNEFGRIPLGMLYFSGEYKGATISEIFNEFVNGHVDAGNEDFILKLKMSDLITPTAHAMLLMGTDFNLVLNFLFNDQVQSIIKNAQKDTLFGKESYPIYNQILNHIQSVKRRIASNPENYSEETRNLFSSFGENIKIEEVNLALSDYYGTREEKENKLSNLFSDLNSQITDPVDYLLVLQQTHAIKSIQSKIRQLTSYTDFNTARYSNPMDVLKIEKTLRNQMRDFTNVNNLISRTSSLPLSTFNKVGVINRMLKAIFPLSFDSYITEVTDLDLAEEDWKFSQKKINLQLMLFIKYQVENNRDDVRGLHSQYFFDSRENKQGLFLELGGPSTIQTDLEDLKQTYPYLNSNAFLSDLSATSTEVRVNGITKTFTEFVINKTVESQKIKEYQLAIEELLNSSIPEIRSVAEDILLGSHYFSLGKRYSPFSLSGKNLIPPRLFQQYNKQAEDYLKSITNRRFTPENIEVKPGPDVFVLPDNGVFVFGSNDRGIHGSGAAQFAVTNLGAIKGQSTGMQGQSFAVRTKLHQNGQLTKYAKLNDANKNLLRSYIISDLTMLIDQAKENPELDYYVTKLGTGLAGIPIKLMSGIFTELRERIGIPNNLILPYEFDTRETMADYFETIKSPASRNIRNDYRAFVSGVDKYTEISEREDITPATETPVTPQASQPSTQASTQEVTFETLTELTDERKESILASWTQRYGQTRDQAIDYINEGLRKKGKEEVLKVLNKKDETGNYCY